VLMYTAADLAHFRTIIVRPVITEKTMTEAAERNKFTFEVDSRANKTEIRRAVEALWGAKVTAVNTMTVRGKERRRSFRYGVGRTPTWKKAIVTLAPGYSIDAFGAT